jgi:hypothetical protein
VASRDPEASRTLLVVGGPAGRSFAVSRADAGRLVAEELPERCYLGDLNGDLMPFVVTIDGAPHVLFAGATIGMAADGVSISSPGGDQLCRSKNDVWMSVPEPFTEGMVINARWLDGERVLFERSATLHAAALEPVFGPGWTFYA